MVTVSALVVVVVVAVVVLVATVAGDGAFRGKTGEGVQERGGDYFSPLCHTSAALPGSAAMLLSRSVLQAESTALMVRVQALMVVWS
jgi:hypothetical protein